MVSIATRLVVRFTNGAMHARPGSASRFAKKVVLAPGGDRVEAPPDHRVLARPFRTV